MKATFTMWSSLHYFMIFFPFIFTIILLYLVRNKSEKTKQNVAIILSITMVIILIARSIFMIVDRNSLNPEAIPFQICHFANFMMLLASLNKNKIFGSIAWCLNFPAGFASVIFADSLTNYKNILNIQGLAYISGHMLIVVVGLYLLFIGIIEIDKKTFIKTCYIVAIMFILSVLVNNLFNVIFAHTHTDANYFYSYKPERGTPLETFYNLGETYVFLGIKFNPVYLLFLALLGVFVMFTFYLIYRLKNKYMLYMKSSLHHSHV